MNWCFKWLKVQQVVVWLHALCEHLTEFLSGGGIKAPKLQYVSVDTFAVFMLHKRQR